MIFVGRRDLSKVRVPAQLISFVGAFCVWVGVGPGDDWRFSTTIASIIALCGLGIMTITYFIEGHLALFIPAQATATIVPVSALVWAQGHGRAWVWTLGWILASVLLYQACLGEVLRRKPWWQDGVEMAVSLLSNTTSLERQLRRIQWTATISLLSALTLANIGAPKPLVYGLGVIAAVSGVITGCLAAIAYARLSRTRRSRSIF